MAPEASVPIQQAPNIGGSPLDPERKKVLPIAAELPRQQIPSKAIQIIAPELLRENIANVPENQVKSLEKKIEAKPPQQAQQPIQASQIVQRQNAREGLPANYVFRASVVNIWRAVNKAGENQIRINLTDNMLAPYPTLKEELTKLNTTALAWLDRCKIDPRGFIGQHRAFCTELEPAIYLNFVEQELNGFLTLANAVRNPNDRVDPDLIRRQHSSIIAYHGVRYLILVDSSWVPP